MLVSNLRHTLLDQPTTRTGSRLQERQVWYQFIQPLVTLFLVSMWVLAIIARPYTWWRVCLVAAMGACFLIVLIVPWLQDFFALKLVGAVLPWAAVGIAAAGAVMLEVAWRAVARRYGA